jgi:rare lipoprotein A
MRLTDYASWPNSWTTATESARLRPASRRLRTLPSLFLMGVAVLSGVGCHHKPTRVAAAPPPPLQPHAPASPSPSPEPGAAAPVEGTPAATIADNQADADFVRTHPVIFREEGLASWYGPPYDKRRGANGQIFNKDALTAAHRTLPMNSLIRVTNLATGQAAIVRVTDRGPFVHDRMLDLSLASAKAIGVWRPGVARVRVEVFAAPARLDSGGRWCVQVGAFKSEKEANKLRDQLTRKYRTANVIEFTGPTGHWVRIRPQADDKGRAVEIAQSVEAREGEAYLVRLD